MRAARPASAHRLAFVSFFAAALLATAAAPARAEGKSADDFIEAADPSVKAKLEDGGIAVRNALTTIIGGGVISHEHLTSALSRPNFALHAHDTLIALAQVQDIPGARETFEKIADTKEEGGIRGAAFELQVGAALGSQVAQIGGKVDGDEVDALLVDGTRVEAKNDAPDDEPTLSSSLFDKAKKQLKLRSRYGNPVMLVINEPLSQGQMESFRRSLGKAASVMVLKKGNLTTQMDREVETSFERNVRLARANLRPVHQMGRAVAHHTARAMRSVRYAYPRARRAIKARRAARTVAR
ncbi:MAG TPA: hypothetical protein VMZ28_06905 [Kofleriaceae bacterium]|nr:hypothetical protein [Kofleriaceae bacterium]